MIENIAIGIEHRQDLLVSDKDTANAYKSGGLDVLATPAMIALMESAAFLLLKNDPINLDSVGTQLAINHVRACKVGTKVWAIAKITGVEGKKVNFIVNAYDSNGEIGNGTHTRYIIDPQKFMSRL